MASHFVTPDMCQPGRAVEASVGRTDFLRAQKIRSSNAGLDSAARLASLAGGHLHISGVTKCEAIGNDHEMAP